MAAVAQESQVFNTGNMALVAYLLNRGFDAQRLWHQGDEVMWEYITDPEIEMIADQFEHGVVSVNIPIYFQFFNKVRDQMYAYMDRHQLRRPYQRTRRS